MNLNNLRNGLQANLVFSMTLLMVSCNSDPAPAPVQTADFETSPESFPIKPGLIDEASGMDVSRNLNGYLWTIQDSQAPHSAFLVSLDGKTIKEFDIPGSSNKDWEDIATAVGPANGVNYIYIADIGNNNLPMTDRNIVYRIPEISDINGSFDESKLEKISFSYPDGPRDAETILVDPLTKDIFIISKEISTAGIYRLAYPQSVTENTVAEKIGTVPSVLFATAGDISDDGSEILVRNYFGVYYWSRVSGETIGQTLLKNPTKQLSIASEPQGESVCFDSKSAGYYTLSEKGTAASVTLNYYKRK